jgi:glycosyltransferase involved in cell wall biosynthesis
MNMAQTADVSIIVANYNNGRYLEEFIESVKASTVEPLELIIVDDGSTDDSLDVLGRYKYLPYLKIIPFAENKGFTTALNTGLDAATGKFIMRADPDDVVLPGRIAIQYQYMLSHPEVDILGANVIYFNDSLKKEVNRSNFPLHHKNICQTYQRGEHGLLHATVIAKAGIYQAYRYQKIFPSEDYELFSRMIRDRLIFANLGSPVNLVRIHPESSTSKLQYQAIRQTFIFRDKVFNTRTSTLRTFWYYLFIRFYRRYQLSPFVIPKYFFLFLTALTYPAKAFQRIFRR